MAEAYSSAAGKGQASWKYQFSAPPATHGTDVAVWFGATPEPNYVGPDFLRAAQTALGNFVRFNDPSIAADVALGAGNAGGDTAEAAASVAAAGAWPPFTLARPLQLNLNQTGGVEVVESLLGAPNTTVYTAPGVVNNFSLVDAYSWEGGRGYRCDMWLALSSRVPE